jgi:uncharacterized protein (DUF1778 family)
VPSEDAVKPQLWELIERAAELVGENRSDFILDAPVVPRPDILLDRSTVAVSPKRTSRIRGALGCRASAE